MAPTAGPVEGGTFVQVLGDGFDSRAADLRYLLCRFNTSAALAIYISTRAAACYSPGMPIGTIILELALNHQDFSSDGTTFTYLFMRISEAQPTGGPVTGGTEIHISGLNLAVTNDVFCTFKFSKVHNHLHACNSPLTHSRIFTPQGVELLSPGTHKAPQIVACFSPPDPYPQSTVARHARVHLTVHESGIPGSVSFVYFQQPTPVDILPRIGPIDGGTILILSGVHFEQYSSHYCCFMLPSYLLFATARFRSATTIECVTPKLREVQNMKVAFDVAVSVVRGLHSHDLSSPRTQSVLFTFHPAFQILDRSPPGGPSLGGTSVQIVVGSLDSRTAARNAASCSFNATNIPAQQMSSQVC